MRSPSLIGLGVQWLAILEAISLIPNAPRLLRQPTGNGAKVYVLPGIFTGDYATKVLRLYLQRLGYEVSGWGLGLNRGQVGRYMREIIKRIEAGELCGGCHLELTMTGCRLCASCAIKEFMKG